jgi:Type II secretion system (T2SS), protein E, N-terminal domain
LPNKSTPYPADIYLRAAMVPLSKSLEADLAGIQIGQLLVEQGVLSPKQVEQIIKVQQTSHRPFGDLAERLFGIDPRAVEDAWVEQYIRTAGIVDLDQIKIEAEALRVLNRRQAWQFHILPLNRDQQSANESTGPNLNMATSSDSLVRAVNFAVRKLDDPIYFLIAERQQLREFLMKHYPVPQYIARYAASM